MRILVIGASGMLGHKLYQSLRLKFDVFASIRRDFESIEKFGIFEKNSIIEHIDATNPHSLRRAVEMVRPDCVVNAVGVIKQVPEAVDAVQNLLINAILPRHLARLSTDYGFRLITIGTDCVFDGKKGNYTEEDMPDARDVYGMSKLLGEITDGNALTLRTSIIGRELGSRHSFVEWFLANRDGAVKGYVNAIYTGFPTIVLAEIISGLIADHPVLSGLYHVSSEPISKYDLLQLINKHFNANVQIEPFADYVIDRSLDSSKFKRDTGFEPRAWDEMIALMVADRLGARTARPCLARTDEPSVLPTA